ncbi:TetR/AcrR family transcriptional regulator [uncultured Hoeflea sp.]|uniref:TetR/AcrR family transcriptional regulator n=1 Tax=uncultured Hoeflea sp. TaxID=538666 RepID=UPI0030EC7629|tara:strand:- start:4303 stop:4872 length:570 start_codon:yes stop_codon:yes gene_type:complete
MKRPTKDAVQERIVEAVIDTVAAQGIGATSMAAVARAAKVSAGTLYLHFASKEEMLQSVYLKLKLAFHADLMKAASGDARQAIAGMWRALLAFQQDQPNGFLFLEYAGAAQVLTPEQKARVAPLQGEVNAVIQRAIDEGIIKVPSLSVAATLLIGPAMQLARTHAIAGTPVPADEANQTFDRIWMSLTA